MAQLEAILTQFKGEHRLVRDTIYRLVDALRDGDVPTSRTELNRLNTLSGPHFRYEEETLYPALVSLFPPGYIKAKIEDHDGAIQTARDLVTLLEQDEITEAEGAEAAAKTLALIIHVSDCDGMGVILERVAEPELEKVATNMKASTAAALPLLTWASTVRARSSARV